MTKYYRVNVMLLSFECHKLKSATKNATDVTLKISPNMIGKYNYFSLIDKFRVFINVLQTNDCLKTHL